jgi:hypothetical protein
MTVKRAVAAYPMSRLALIVVFIAAILAVVTADAAELRRISHNESE